MIFQYRGVSHTNKGWYMAAVTDVKNRRVSECWVYYYSWLENDFFYLISLENSLFGFFPGINRQTTGRSAEFTLTTTFANGENEVNFVDILVGFYWAELISFLIFYTVESTVIHIFVGIEIN